MATGVQVRVTLPRDLKRRAFAVLALREGVVTLAAAGVEKFLHQEDDHLQEREADDRAAAPAHRDCR